MAKVFNHMYLMEYKRKLISAEDAALLVESDSIVDYGAFASKPVAFDAALSRRCGTGLTDVSVRGTATILPLPQVMLNDTKQETFTYFSRFFTEADRKAAEFGLSVHLPLQYYDAGKISGEAEYFDISPDVWVAQVAPMDSSGCFNFGLANFHNRSLALQAGITIVEINENMPRCLGGSNECLHISEIDYIIEAHNPAIFSAPPAAPPNREESIVARMIMEEIEDGACLQLGRGIICDAVGNMIADSDLKNLGLHSEIFCDSYVKMIMQGQVTNIKKTTDRNKSVYSYCLATAETYDFLNDNPRCASYSIDYTNNPKRISINSKVVSLGYVLEMDLLGQVCSESHGLRQISGIGGQLDFIIGAFNSEGGKSFLAFTSSFKDKSGHRQSRIRPLLTSGAAVSVPRSMTHYVVTEYGKVNLKRLSTWGRAAALIELAHPDFRAELIEEARRMKIWSRTNRIPF
ncbi:MAG: acetyl-CoA hydrolase/transferase C-terminal domain-containing protein [Syntrophomonadaceae bacterium]|nr:acetyl-CoA hydrolase/transferase C-terminal domain-containing protein [Syntrophomonadaceae bacterium]